MEMRRVTVALCFAGLAGTAAAAEGPQEKSAGTPQAIFRGAFKAVKFDISEPLRDMVPGILPMTVEGREADEDRPFPSIGTPGPRDVDTVVQSKVGPGVPGPNVSFDAFTNMCGCSPPDSDGDVGPNHYVVMVNLHFAVYTKAGALLFGPVANNTLWTT